MTATKRFSRSCDHTSTRRLRLVLSSVVCALSCLVVAQSARAQCSEINPSPVINVSESFSRPGGGRDPYQTITVRACIYPEMVSWIAWNDRPEVSLFVASRPNQGLLGPGGFGTDDYIELTVTNPSGRSVSIKMDQNDEYGASFGPQNLILGSRAQAPDVYRKAPFGPKAGQELFLDEEGAFNSLFTAPGEYSFTFAFRDNSGGRGSHGHQKIFLLVEYKRRARAPISSTPDDEIIGRCAGTNGGARIIRSDGQEVRVEIDTPISVGDRLITGPNSRVRAEIPHLGPTGSGPALINIGPDTEVIWREFQSEVERGHQAFLRKRGVFEILHGWFRSIAPWWGSDSAFTTKGGSTICGIRGTDYVVRYEPGTDTFEAFVNEGAIDLYNGGQVLPLAAGSSVKAERNQFGAVRPLDPTVWKDFVSDAPPEAPAATGRQGKPLGGGNEVWLQLRFQGRVYQVLYERHTDNGVPIDVYFYRTTAPPGVPAPRGEAQWSRFVRVPAADSPNATSVEWWHGMWVQRGGVWEFVGTKGAQFELLGPAATGTPDTKRDRAKDIAANSAGPGYSVRYQGRIYQTIHRVDTDAGIPIDIYFYPITQPDGTQAMQNNEKLWGRFVRKPAADFPNLTSVEWWHGTWVQRGGVWEQANTKGVRFEVLGKLP